MKIHLTQAEQDYLNVLNKEIREIDMSGYIKFSMFNLVF